MTDTPGEDERPKLLKRRPRQVERDGWILRLFGPQPDTTVPLVAGAVSIGLFVLGGLVVVVGHLVGSFDAAVVYHRTPVFYVYAFWTFLLLWVLSHWSQNYVLLWDTLRRSFDVPDERYEEIVDRGLSLLYRLEVPVLVFLPMQLVTEIVSPVTLESSVPLPERMVFEGFQLINNLLFVVILYLLFVHFLLVKRVLSLPLSNLYGATTELKPLAEFSVSLTTKYFANLAVLVFAVYFVLDARFLQITLGTGIVDALGLTGWELLFSGVMFTAHVLVGLLAFFVPIQFIHRRVETEQRNRLIELDHEHEVLLEAFLDDEDAEELPARIEELDRIRERTNGINTWPFRLPSLLKVFLSSLAPVITYLLDSLGPVP